MTISSTSPVTPWNPHEVNHELLHDIESFLYYEAELLDDGRFDEWLELLTEDFQYEVPLRLNVSADQRQRGVTDPANEICWFNEGKDTLVGRVLQLKSGEHWSEEPISRYTHIITNIRVSEVREADVVVNSALVFYRNRVADEVDVLTGRRSDTLRRTESGWRIARRYVLLNQNVLIPKNLTIPL